MIYNIKIQFNDQVMDFLEAINKGIVNLTKTGIEAKNARLLLSSCLKDNNKNEVFEEDTLLDKEGNEYIVKRIYGSFIIQCTTKNKGCPPILLSSLRNDDILIGFVKKN